MSKYFAIDNPNVKSGTFHSCNIKKINDNGETEIYKPYDGFLSFDSNEWSVFRSRGIDRTEGSALSSDFRISNTLTSTESSSISGEIKLRGRTQLTKLNRALEVSKEGRIEITPSPNKEFKEPYLYLKLLDGYTLQINLRLNAYDFELLAEDIKQRKLSAIIFTLSNIAGIYESSDSFNLKIIDAHQNIKKSKGSLERPAGLGEVGGFSITEIYNSKRKESEVGVKPDKSGEIDLLKKEVTRLSAEYSKNTTNFHTALKLIIFLLIVSTSILSLLLSK